MRAALLCILLSVLTCSVQAQSKVTFQLNLDTFVEEQLFTPDGGMRVYVRGSFNNWQGTAYELAREAMGNLYTGSFDLDGNAGDTVSYKYVIEKDRVRNRL